jgi:hypothetical protein
MVFAGLHKSSGPTRRWWVVTVRVLALVFALSVSAPMACLACDIDFHGRGQPARAERGTVGAPSTSTDAADPCLSCHLHCGCHQLAAVAAGPVLPVVDSVKRVYPRVTEKVSSLPPDCLLRPPAGA